MREDSAMSVLLYAGSDRWSTSAPGRVTRHSFSFGEHYDPANLGFGPLLCHNDDTLDPGAGYPEHPHAELEIVTWVLDGALVHTDSTGARHVLEAGRAQVLTAGSGIRHSEVADPGSGRCRFIQAWLTPDSPGSTPSYAVGEGVTGTGELVDVAGGDGLPIGAPRARLLVARLLPGQAVDLPVDPRQHVFAATGSVTLDGGPLRGGDAVRVSGEAARTVRADPGADGTSTLLVWSFGD